MPAKSRKQRRAAAIAKLIKMGKMKAQPGSASAQMAQMPMSSLDELAGTPERNLPLRQIGGGNVPGRPGGGRRLLMKDKLRRVGGSKRNVRGRV